MQPNPNESFSSRRRPIEHQDDVDLAIEQMGHKIRFLPLWKYWWRYLVLFLVVFVLLSYFGPTWTKGGPVGIGAMLANLAVSLAINATFAIFFIYIQFFAIARPRAYWLKPHETGVTFKDYKGNPQVLEMAREVVLLLKGNKDFKNMGGEYIRGLLLEGDPGVGKSYLAQAIASEAGVPFGYCSSPSLQSPFLAGGMLSVRNLYKKARKLSAQYGGCILFLDEIDAIGQARSGSMNGAGGGIGGMFPGMGGGGNYLINELLLQLDPPPVDNRWTTKALRWIGLDLNRKKAEVPPVLTIAATNLSETLDRALLRPGRFDRQIMVGLPDTDGRREIAQYYLDKVNHENVPLDRFVNETVGYTPVAIKYVINEAVVRAHFEGRDAITYKDLIAARDMHEVGLRQPIRSMSLEERRRIAYHETGHAIAQALLVPWQRIVKVTIVRHGDALGFMQPKEKEERHTQTKEEIETRIQVSLASRAAEEIFLKTQMTGFAGDLASATQMAIVYCGSVGMNGHLFSMSVLQSSPATMQVEVENFLEQQFKKVKQLLMANQDMCHALAAALLEKDELLEEEVMEIINRFTPNLTADAKAKRMGFHLIKGTENAEDASSGVAVEGVRTGTYTNGGYGDEDGVVFPAASAMLAKSAPLLPPAPRPAATNSVNAVANGGSSDPTVNTTTSQNVNSKSGEANNQPKASLQFDEESFPFPTDW